MNQTKSELLVEYAKSPLRQSFEIGYDVEELFCRETEELRYLDYTRVLIPARVSQKEAVAQLEKILDWLKSEPTLIERFSESNRTGKWKAYAALSKALDIVKREKIGSEAGVPF